MNDIRNLITLCETPLADPRAFVRTRGFIQMATEMAEQHGIRAILEPMVIGMGVQITWMERRRDARVDIDGFLKQLISKADESDMILQLAVPGHDPTHEAIFRRYGFQVEHGGPDLIMQRQPEATFISDRDMNESAPPGKKAERFIRKHKSDFKDRYGKRWKKVLYATAWKQFGEGASFRDYFHLIEGLES